MEKGTKILIGTVATIGIGTVAFFLWKGRIDRLRAEAELSKPVVEVGPTSYVPRAALCSKFANFPLRKGSKGMQVGNLQRFINQFNRSNTLKIDCDWGSKTQLEYDKIASKGTAIKDLISSVATKPAANALYS